MKQPVPHRDNNALLLRLSKIEGQVRGIKSMIEQNRPCDDVIVQLSSASAALQSTAKAMLLHHIDTCVLQEVQNDNAIEALDNLKNILDKYSKIK